MAKNDKHEKMRRQLKGLTKEQLKALGDEHTKMWEQAVKQRNEYVGSLEMAIRNITTLDGKPAPDAFLLPLIESAQKTQVHVVMREPNLKDEKGQPTITAIYEFDDHVFFTFRDPPDGFVFPKNLVDDFKAMTTMPTEAPQHQALPMSRPGWREQMLKKMGSS